MLSNFVPEINILSVGNYTTIANPAFSYLWTISGAGASIIGANNMPNVIVTNLPSPNVTYTLTLTVTTLCLTRSVSKVIVCSIPRHSYYDVPDGNGQYSICPNDHQEWFNVHLGAYVLTPLVYIDYYHYHYHYVSFRSVGNYVYYAYSNSPTYVVELIEGIGCRVVAPTPKTPTFIVSPNPSSGNEITISQEVSEQSKAKNEEFTFILCNKLQVKVRETTLNTPSKTISTEGLPNDVYFLHIIDKNGNKVIKQVIILR